MDSIIPRFIHDYQHSDNLLVRRAQFLPHPSTCQSLESKMAVIPWNPKTSILCVPSHLRNGTELSKPTMLKGKRKKNLEYGNYQNMKGKVLCSIWKELIKIHPPLWQLSRKCARCFLIFISDLLFTPPKLPGTITPALGHRKLPSVDPFIHQAFLPSVFWLCPDNGGR